MRILLRGHKGLGGPVEGEALVSRDPIHFSTDFDEKTGIGKTRGHAMFGKRIVSKILVAPTPKGGVASSISLPQLVKNGVGPKAVIFAKANPVLVQGALLAGIPIMDRFEQNPTEVIKAGDYLRLDPEAGVVEVERRGK